MIDYKDRAAVKDLAQQYQMPESYVRQMLAIEAGENIDDVIEVAPRTSIAPKVALWSAVAIVLCAAPFAIAAIR